MTITTFIEQRLMPLTLAFASGVAITVAAIKADPDASARGFDASRVTIECYDPGPGADDNGPRHNANK